MSLMSWHVMRVYLENLTRPRYVSGMTTSSIRIYPENVANLAIAHQLKAVWNAGAECHQGNT